MTPGLVSYWQPTVAALPDSTRATIARRLFDFDSERLQSMSAAGVARSILSIAGPGVQAEADTALAIRRAQESNDELARAIQRHPERFDAFAHLPMQDPQAAADELERCVSELGFKGSMINGSTRGLFLDNAIYDVFWERTSALQVPVYLHPADPIRTFATLEDYPDLQRATWGWTVETASHALRMVFGGVFDRHPQATLLLGHMGETLPFMLWRLDSRYRLYEQARPLQHLPSYYLRHNVMITTSGQCSRQALVCSIEALGADRVMFSIDYPFESSELAGQFMGEVEVAEEVRERVGSLNASRLFNYT